MDVFLRTGDIELFGETRQEFVTTPLYACKLFIDFYSFILWDYEQHILSGPVQFRIKPLN